MDNEELYHHGILGQKWGIRRFQKSDGTLTSAGKKRYDSSVSKQKVNDTKAAYKYAKKEYNKAFNKAYNKAHQAYSLSSKKRRENDERWANVEKKAKKLTTAEIAYKDAKKQYKEENKDQIKANRQKAIKIGAAAVGSTLAVYGGHKLKEYINSENGKIAHQVGLAAANKSARNGLYFSKGSKIYNLSYNLASNPVKNTNFVGKAKNVYNYKRFGELY